MPIVLRSEKAGTKKVTLFLVAGDSSYSNHKFSALVFVCFFVFLKLQSTVFFWIPTRNNLLTCTETEQKKITTKEHYSALKRHLLPRYRHFFLLFYKVTQLQRDVVNAASVAMSLNNPHERFIKTYHHICTDSIEYSTISH